jgi:integrase
LLLRVLWCLGTRTGETLELRTGDVNTINAVITIRRAKGGKTRLIPMSKSLTAFTINYLRHTGIVCDPQAWLFPSIYGGHLSHPAVVHRVHTLMLQAGVTVDGGRPARIHDIRHSYAVGALAKMQTEGMDPYTCLPLLATIMGHAAIRHTEYYLRLTGPAQAQITASDTIAYPSIQVN